MENERTTTGPRLRVPVQALPVTRALVTTTLSDSVDRVGASSIRSVLCAVSAGGACGLSGPAAGKCFDKVYDHCMGKDED